LEIKLAAMRILGNLIWFHSQPMNIVIVGAGRIGSAFAFRLARAGHRVTVVARGARLEALHKAGALVSVDDERVPVEVTAELDCATPYDLVLVTVLGHQVESLMPSLRASAAQTVMLMFNTFEPLELWRDAIGRERFAFGFPNMIAFLSAGKLRSIVDGPGMVTTVSSTKWAAEFKQAGFPTEVEPDMESFLRSHVAFYVPSLVAALLVWQRPTGLSWREASRLAAAMQEALSLVQGLGHTLKPRPVAWMARLPAFVLTALTWALARTRALRDLGEFGPTEARNLIDAMAAAAPGKATKLLAIRP
jgi:2-dehydropantoate 2-reductase